ncbi:MULTISPECIES: helix-turn-helix domain-containing protein [Streptomyces]|uniref:helix-turn-helix domain-containing protein n=1 Tax=Streptomyces TaxID=1883 RepID=UPI00081B82DD|nr:MULTISPECIES: helix-turn-helix transcriptional regulator [unclassified Streptomyces]MYQ54405.1 helix-turn-helix domain-containing protein [Streptomyces sp. SID4941]SCE22860.1 Helix-turn-helix [Streptomyces sp. PalvLS-984]SDE32776.1 Helix-turn-helix [Streptomyces sp. AmelKG-A3]
MSEQLSPLDGEMNARRLQLGLAWKEVAASAGISYETLRAVRKGESAAAPLTARKIEQALRWAQGSLARVEQGKAPVPASAGESAGPPSADPDPRAAAVMTILEGLPPRVQRQVLARLNELAGDGEA